jgi:hypothetical protein
MPEVERHSVADVLRDESMRATTRGDASTANMLNMAAMSIKRFSAALSLERKETARLRRNNEIYKNALENIVTHSRTLTNEELSKIATKALWDGL